MTQFEQLFERAMSDDRQALEDILLLVEPIISRNSVINGRIDEDLRQQIILRILVEQKKWKGVQKSEC